VVKYIKAQVETIHNLLDGKNVDAALTEFGIRLHRVISDHLQQFQFNSMGWYSSFLYEFSFQVELTIGAMLAICDVNEYRKCIKEFGIPQLDQIFDSLHSLCNLLVVVPEHLKEVCTGEQLVSFLFSFPYMNSLYLWFMPVLFDNCLIYIFRFV
jgi:recyclin-1